MEFETVRKIIAEQMSIDESDIKEDSTFEDFKVDSLDMVEIVMKLEEELGVSLEKVENIKTVKELTEYIKAQKA